MKHSVLLIHNDPSVRRATRSVLEAAGYSVKEDDSLRPAAIGSPDALIIGWQLLMPVSESLRWLRSHDQARDARVLVLVDRNSIDAAIASLEMGADDCIAAPVVGRELLVRLAMSLKRPPAVPVESELRAGPIELDPLRHRVSVDGQMVELAPTEFRLMSFLLKHQGRVFSREELLTRAWSRSAKAGPRTVDVHVRRLRQQLEPFGCEAMIQTVRGFGYRLRVGE